MLFRSRLVGRGISLLILPRRDKIPRHFAPRNDKPREFLKLPLLLSSVFAGRGVRSLRIDRYLSMRSAVISLLIVFSCVNAQSVRSYVNKGNDLYEKKQYSDAEAEYRKSLEKDKDLMQGSYNLGNAVYKQQRFDEAIQNYHQALSKTGDPKTQSQLHYNMGNSYFDAQQYQESINAYKKSLKLNPNDEDAKYNLAYAYKKLKEQQQQQNQQQKQNKDKKQDDKQKQDQQQQQDQQKKEQAQQQAQQQQQQKKMSQEEAKRILEALKNDEKKTQKKVRQKAPVRMNVEKDW